MEREIKGKYVNGKVELGEGANLEEGEDVRVVVSLPEQNGSGKSFMSTSGAWKDDAEYWDEFLREWYMKRGRTTR